LLAVGLAVVFFFMPYLVAGRKPTSQPFLLLNHQPSGSAMFWFHDLIPNNFTVLSRDRNVDDIAPLADTLVG
jgi:hypothetical protein